jgi:hypothetical protein
MPFEVIETVYFTDHRITRAEVVKGTPAFESWKPANRER